MGFGGGSPAGGGMGSIIIMVAMVAMFYFLVIRPQKKREKEVAEMRNSLKAGDEIITIGGICGKVISTKEDFIVLEVTPSKVKMKMTKWAVSTVTGSKNVAQKSEEVKETELEVSTEEETSVDSE